MRRVGIALVSVVLLGTALGTGKTHAQQVTVQTPQQTLTDRFYERNGIQWGVNWRNGFFRFGGPAAGVPQFGGYVPGAGAQMGLGFGGPGYRGYFNATAAQGSRRSLVGQTPFLTLTDGVPGFIADTSLTPFVTGFVPVVGGYEPGFVPPVALPGPSPVVERLQRMAAGEQPGPRASPPPTGGAPAKPADPPSLSAVEPEIAGEPGGSSRDRAVDSSTAAQAVPSVAQARRIRAAEQAEQDAEALVFWEEGQSAEADGKIGAAKVFYRMAARRAAGEFRQKITQRLEALNPPPKPETRGQEF